MVLLKLPLALQAVLLLVLSAAFVWLLRLLHLPAALLLGPMAAAIIFAAVAGTSVHVPKASFLGAQAIVGCMIAGVLLPSTLREILRIWPLFLIMTLAVVVASNGLGWVLARMRVLPGSTAIWGSSPGGATVMVLMSEAFGADIRLVALMQYLRVVFVALVATLVDRISTAKSAVASAATIWFPALAIKPFFETIGLSFAGIMLARLTRIPGGPMLIPLFLGAALHDTGLITIELPPWLLATSYMVIGWSIGLRFTREILVYAAHALPRIALSIIILIAICGGLAKLLVLSYHVDPLTAYLATSPGGLDSTAIIAASTPNINIAFIMGMQTARFLVVVIVGPPLARLFAKTIRDPAPEIVAPASVTEN